MLRIDGWDDQPDRWRRWGMAAGIAVLTLAAAWLRLDGLGDSGLWRDEAQCIFIAQKSFPAGIVEALLHEAHPPLYYALQHFWIPLVGWTEFRIRLLSAFFGILTIPLLYIAGRRFFGPWAGLGAALWATVSPLHIMVSRTARMYSLLAFLSLLSLYLLYEAWHRGGWARWAGYILVTTAALYTHNWALFLLIAHNGFALWMLIRRREWGRRLAPWVLTQIIIGLAYLPWFFDVLKQIPIIAVLPFVPVPTPAEKLAQMAGDLLANGPAMALWLILFLIGMWPAEDRRDGALGLTLLSGLGTLAIGLLVSLRTYGQAPSYVAMVAFPALALLLGRGLSRIRPAWLALPLAVGVVFFSARDMDARAFMFTSTLREVAQAVEQQAGPEDVIVIAPDYIATTFNTYYHGDQPQIAFPWTMGRLEEIDCVGWNARWERAAEAVPATIAAVEASLGENGRLWFIAAPDEFPGDEEYYGQIRRLKSELDAHFQLETANTQFRRGAEWADIYVYRRR